MNLKKLNDSELLKLYELHRILSNVLDSALRHRSEKILTKILNEIKKRKEK